MPLLIIRVQEKIHQPVISFVQKLKLQSPSRSKLTTREVCRILLPKEVQPETIEEFSNIRVQIPSVCPNLLFTQCKVLEIGYYVNLLFDAAGPDITTSVPIEFIIGTGISLLK